MSRLEQTVSPDLWITQRSEKREPIVGNATFEYPFTGHGNRGYDVITRDVSRSGACIYTIHKLEPGKTITIFGKVIGDSPRRGHVRWCRQEDEEIFSAGIALS